MTKENVLKNVVNFGNQQKSEEFENILVNKIPVAEFLSYPSVPMQRNTEERAKTNKVKKMLRVLKPTHLEVALVVLNNTDTYYGKTYEKGWTGIVNGNTRRFYWQNNLTDRIPSHVLATIYGVNNMEEVRDIYNQYDNPDQMERNQEKVFGLLVNVYGFTPTCEKIICGEIITALNFSCHVLDPKMWNQPKTNSDHLLFQLGTFLEEIKMFDKICKRRSNWDQALVATALLALKKYGNNPKLIDCLTRIDERNMNTCGSEWDGATHICLEWENTKRFPVKGTNWDKAGGFKETVSFALYWVENYINGVKLKQLGFNWKETYLKWFDKQNKVNNNLSKLFDVDVKN